MNPYLVASEFRDGLKSIYWERLKRIYLYGSYARAEADGESDIDILVVLDLIDHYFAEVDRTSQLTSEISLKYGVSVSRVFVSEQDWSSGESFFLDNARQEAVPI